MSFDAGILMYAFPLIWIVVVGLIIITLSIVLPNEELCKMLNKLGTAFVCASVAIILIILIISFRSN